MLRANTFVAGLGLALPTGGGLRVDPVPLPTPTRLDQKYRRESQHDSLRSQARIERSEAQRGAFTVRQQSLPSAQVDLVLQLLRGVGKLLHRRTNDLELANDGILAHPLGHERLAAHRPDAARQP